MDESTLITILKDGLRDCAGWDGDPIAEDRVHALNYYFQRERGDEVTGRSTVVSGDLSAMVEANLAQMMDAFASDNIVEFDSFGREDEDQAQLESDVVALHVMKRNAGRLQLATAIKDALLQRVGTIKVWCDYKTEVKSRVFDNVEPEARAVLPDGSYNQRDKTLSVKDKTERKTLRCEAVAPENFFYPRSYDSFDMQRIPFCAERHVDTRSDLVAMGFPRDRVKDLKAHANDSSKGDEAARSIRSLLGDDRTPSVDSSQDLIEWYEIYALIDTDKDGISERRRLALVWSQEVLLENIPVDRVPYACGVVMMNPHRLTGISQYDKLRNQQDKTTGLERALLDTVNTVLKNRTAYLDGLVNVDDVGDGRTNGSIRVNRSVGDVRSAVMPFTIPDQSLGILQNLEYQKTIRTELGGAALELATGQMQIGGDRLGSQGLDRAYSVMEQLGSLMMKTVADTLIRSVFLLAHATLRENISDPVEFKRSGHWTSVIPARWRERTELTVKLGLSPGERSRKTNALTEILNSQIELAKLGMDGVLVDISGFYRALMDWGRVSEIPNPEQYFLDPAGEASQKAAAEKQRVAEETKQEQRALMDMALQLEQMRTAMDKYKQDTDLQFKYWEAVLGAQVKEAEIAGAATIDLLKVRNDAQRTGNAAQDQSATSGDSEAA